MLEIKKCFSSGTEGSQVSFFNLSQLATIRSQLIFADKLFIP